MSPKCRGGALCEHEHEPQQQPLLSERTVSDPISEEPTCLLGRSPHVERRASEGRTATLRVESADGSQQHLASCMLCLPFIGLCFSSFLSFFSQCAALRL